MNKKIMQGPINMAGFKYFLNMANSNIYYLAS